MKFGKTESKLIIVRGEPLTEQQLASALRVSEETMWWRAVIQIIEEVQSDSFPNAAGAAGSNNPLSMAANVGAYVALDQLLCNLEERRASSSA
jgi:hypothetical protein